jgi:hypothetical protein
MDHISTRKIPASWEKRKEPEMTKALTLEDEHFGGIPWNIRAHIDDDGQLVVFVLKGNEQLTENYSRSDDGPGWVTSYIPNKTTEHPCTGCNNLESLLFGRLQCSLTKEFVQEHDIQYKIVKAIGCKRKESDSNGRNQQ